MKKYDEPEIFVKHLKKLVGGTPRERALKSGELRTITPLAQENGFLCPVHMTTAAWQTLLPRGAEMATGTRRLWDMLSSLRFSARDSGGAALINFSVPVPNHESRYHSLELKAVCGPGDTTPTVITIMLPQEDPACFDNDIELTHKLEKEI